MGFGIGNCRITGHIQAAILECTGKSLGIVQYRFLVVVLKVIHFISSKQQSEKRTQMVITETARKRAALDRFPEIVLLIHLRVICRHDAALRSKKRFVCGSGDDIGTFLKRLLKMRANQSQHMRHVIH